MLMRCIKKTTVIIAVLVYSAGFFYAQEFECECKGGTAYKISAELTQITGELRLRINEADVVLYVNGARIGSPFLCFSLVPAAKKNDNASCNYFEQNGVQSFGRIQAGSDLCILIPKTLWMPAAGIYYTQDSNGENGFVAGRKNSRRRA